MKSFYKCLCLEEGLKLRHGDFIHLTYDDACGMAAAGAVRIVDETMTAVNECLKLAAEMREVIRSFRWHYRGDWSARKPQ